MVQKQRLEQHHVDMVWFVYLHDMFYNKYLSYHFHCLTRGFVCAKKLSITNQKGYLNILMLSYTHV